VIRVYLDTNVFTQLKNNPDFKLYLQKFLEAKRYLLFVYSQAHIADLKHDSTDNKYSDLEFMYQLVDTNYLVYDILKSKCNTFIATPPEAFNSLTDDTEPKSSISESEIDLLLSLKDVPILKEFKVLFEAIDELRTLNNDNRHQSVTPSIPDQLSAKQKKWLYDIGLEKKNYSWDEWTQYTESINEKFKTDKKFYKRGRAMALELYQGKLVHYSIEHKLEYLKNKYDIDFYDAIQKIVEQLMTIPGFGSDFMKFTMMYSLLNILGVDNEPNSKAKLSSTLNDAMHTYYAQFTDYFVTNDNGILEKANFVYEHYGVDTKVMNLIDFINELTLLDSDVIDHDAFISSLLYELNHGFIIKQSNDILTGTICRRIKPIKRFFSYFNEIQTFDNPNRKNIKVCVLLKRSNLSQPMTLFKEIQSVTDKIAGIYGVDINQRLTFDEVDEVEVRGSESWKGRMWEWKDFFAKLEYNSDFKSIIFVIDLLIS
jgi:hypothetical protein